MEEKTLNQIREEHGIKPIENGDVAYCSLSELNKKLSDKNEESILGKVLTKYTQQTYILAREFINELKREAVTYGELDKRFNELKKSLFYIHSNHERLNHFLNVVEKLIGEEKNDLPLTNRSE